MFPAAKDFATELSEMEGIHKLMANTTKLNIDKATVRQLFKAVAKVSDELIELSFILGQNKRRLQVQQMAHASEFYVPIMYNDRIFLTSNGYPDI